MESIIERVWEEYSVLSDKVTKLREFLLNEVDKAPIDNLNKDLLITQLKIMESYQGILSIRIGLNHRPDSKTEDTKVSE